MPFLSMPRTCSLCINIHTPSHPQKTQKKMGNFWRHISGHDMQEKAMNNIEEKGPLEDHNNLRDFTSSSSTTTTSTTVKIKITKKQLKELLGKAEVKGLSVQQILSQLMNASGDHRSYDQPQQQSWRPNLQSIPE
nr:uncharacterized protein LOC118035710 [Populus alba]